MSVTQGGEGPYAGRQDGRRKPTPADPVKQIMTRQPVGVPGDATLREVAGKLADDEIGAVLVLSPGGPVWQEAEGPASVTKVPTHEAAGRSRGSGSAVGCVGLLAGADDGHQYGGVQHALQAHRAEHGAA